MSDLKESVVKKEDIERKVDTNSTKQIAQTGSNNETGVSLLLSQVKIKGKGKKRKTSQEIKDEEIINNFLIITYATLEDLEVRF